jgi:outer membrane protein assembly factor BamB
VLVDDKVYIGDEDGDVAIFRHSDVRQVAMPDGRPLAEIDLGSAVYGSPIVANGVLYFATRHLLAIAEADSEDGQ